METVNSCEKSNNIASHTEVDDTYVLHRRFDRMGRLVGDRSMAKLMGSHAMVVGLGGVGSWAAESLVRSGFGRVTVIDFDAVCITNTNRQLHAMRGAIGRKKSMLVEERLKKINPAAEIVGLDMFYEKGTSDAILAHQPDVVIDAIDNITAKCHLLATCVQRGIKVVSSGGSGSRFDPFQLTHADLANSYKDPMLKKVRQILRIKYDFPREGEMGIRAVFSKETPSDPQELTYDGGKGFRCVCPMGDNSKHSCENRNVIHGTTSFVTGAFGLALASLATKAIIRD